MRRILIALAAVLSLSVGTAVAQAHQTKRGWDHGGPPAFTPAVAVKGTVVSVDPSANSFVADAVLLPGHHKGEFGRRDFGRDWGGGFGGGQPTPQQVTITTNSSTMIEVNGQKATISSLAAGDQFIATFPVPSSSTAPTSTAPTSTSTGGVRRDWGHGGGIAPLTLQEVVANPALAVFARTPPPPPPKHQLYAFVGTVSAVDTTADTVTVSVSASIPSGFFTSPATFTVSPDTLILGGNATGGLFGGTLSGVTVGDVVAGGEIGISGETAAQVEASPLRVLIDFPVSSTSTATTTATTKARALKKAEALLGVKSHKKTHKKATHKKARRHHSRRTHARKHAKRA